jgi:hypothetical protein
MFHKQLFALPVRVYPCWDKPQDRHLAEPETGSGFSIDDGNLVTAPAAL